MEEVNIPEKEENSLEEFALPGIISARFKRAEDARYSAEQRWLKAYRNYRGIYSSDMAFSSKEKSRIFVKITKTKVLASFGQLTSLMMGFALISSLVVLPALLIMVTPNSTGGSDRV